MTDTYHYTFSFDDGSRISLDVILDSVDLTYQNPPPAELPDWTRLEYMQCLNCPLDPNVVSHCPVAVNLVQVSDSFNETVSHRNAVITIRTKERTYMKECGVQEGLGALLGIVMATSGCPVLDKLRPMVRTHLPFSSFREILYRAVSMYIMAQQFREKKGLEARYDLNGLREIYEAVSDVNHAMSNRMRAHFDEDANVNAIVVLNCMAQFTAITLEDDLLDELDVLFKAYYS
jgi:hypothetical protein